LVWRVALETKRRAALGTRRGPTSRALSRSHRAQKESPAVASGAELTLMQLAKLAARWPYRDRLLLSRRRQKEPPVASGAPQCDWTNGSL